LFLFGQGQTTNRSGRTAASGVALPGKVLLHLPENPYGDGRTHKSPALPLGEGKRVCRGFCGKERLLPETLQATPGEGSPTPLFQAATGFYYPGHRETTGEP